ncbi:MAG: YIP1 family protein [Actinomycetota bacterium]|nr:YIP1 family protein [Actinomycetota bacterium]
MDFDTGSRPDAAGSGGSRGGAGVRPPGTSASAGGEFDYRDPIQSFVVTVRRLVVEPVAFFRGMNRQGDFVNPLLFAVICWEISAIIGGLLGVLGSLVGLGVRGLGEAIVGFFASLILTPIFALAVLFIAAGIIHLLVVLIARPMSTGFETTFRAIAYANVTALVSWIPILGVLIGTLWYVVLSVFGVREGHATSTGKAVVIVLIPVAIALFILLVLAAVVGAVIFGALSNA